MRVWTGNFVVFVVFVFVVVFVFIVIVVVAVFIVVVIVVVFVFIVVVVVWSDLLSCQLRLLLPHQHVFSSSSPQSMTHLPLPDKCDSFLHFWVSPIENLLQYFHQIRIDTILAVSGIMAKLHFHTWYLSQISQMGYVEKICHVEIFQISIHDRRGEFCSYSTFGEISNFFRTQMLLWLMLFCRHFRAYAWRTI